MDSEPSVGTDSLLGPENPPVVETGVRIEFLAKNLKTCSLPTVFVQKLFKPIPVPIDFTEKTRLAEKICGGSHRNIVGLLGKGYSENLQYYMQMEECDLSLEEYVNHGKVAHRLLAWPTHPWPTDNFEHTNKQNQRVFIIVAILQQILSGLVHIHKHKTIHGNLHPRNVLYSSRCGWWKIADFGIHDMAIGYIRKNTGYSAPDLLRKISFDRNVDTWSLGCILFELCTGRRKFGSDREVMELGPEDTGPNLSFEQPQWLRDQETSTTFKNWIAEMLDLHCGRRPSAKSLGQRFHELLQHLSPVPTTTDQTTIWDKIREEFLCPKYLLGTDVPPTYQGTLRFENVMPQGAIRAEQTKLLASADEMACAREILLGRKHNYTLWIKTRHAWIRHLVLGFIPRSRTVTTELFTNLLALKHVVLGLEHPETVAVQVGLAWSKAIDHPQEAVDLFIEGHNTQREALGQYHPETLSSKAGVAMAYLLQVTATKESFTDAVEPIPQQDGLHSNANDRERKEQLQIGVGMLEKVLDCQSNLEELGSNHPETAETMAILAWGYGLMERWEDAVRLYKQAADVQTHTLGNAHPDTIRTQIELGTIHLKLGNAVMARDYFDQALKMQDVLGVGQGETESAKRGRAETYKLARKMEAERLKRPRI